MARAFPGFAGAFARHSLTRLPTPVHRLERLERTRNLGPLWIKRDDVSCPLYGGNKPRKLEWLLGDALRRGRRSVMTFGGIGTHHGLATAICARDAGLRTILVLLPQPATPSVRRCLLLDAAFGAEVHLAESVAGVVTKSLRLLARGAAAGDTPAIVPTGGTSARGIIGYVNAAFELAGQVRAGELPEPHSIFVPLGSGGTVAGLVLGLKLAGLSSRVVAVLVTDILPPSAVRLARLARACWRRLHRRLPDLPPVSLGGGDVARITSHLGSGYGAPTEEGVRAQRLLADVEGIALETTYTAKCMAALLDLAREPPWRDQRLLFWNTYSSIDPGESIPLPDFRALPRPFRRFFESSVADAAERLSERGRGRGRGEAEAPVRRLSPECAR